MFYGGYSVAGPTAVQWLLDEFTYTLGTLGTTRDDLLIAVELGGWYPL